MGLAGWQANFRRPFRGSFRFSTPTQHQRAGLDSFVPLRRDSRGAVELEQEDAAAPGLLSFAHLLRKVVLQPRLLDDVQLCFEEVDMLLFVD